MWWWKLSKHNHSQNSTIQKAKNKHHGSVGSCQDGNSIRSFSRLNHVWVMLSMALERYPSWLLAFVCSGTPWFADMRTGSQVPTAKVSICEAFASSGVKCPPPGCRLPHSAYSAGLFPQTAMAGQFVCCVHFLEGSHSGLTDFRESFD